MDNRQRLAEARLYLVTDGARDDLDTYLDGVLAAGVDIVQLRDKRADDATLLERGKVFRGACDRRGALFFVNDRVDLALAADADGVHVGQSDLHPSKVREMAGERLLIGRSTHAPHETAAAEIEPVDYIACGPVYATPTKPGRPATGLDLIRFAAQTCQKPWFAIGGLNEQTLTPVLRAGASRIVVVRAIDESADPAASIAALLGLCDANR